MFERQMYEKGKKCIYKQQRITHVSHAKTTKVSRYFNIHKFTKWLVI